MHDIRIGLFWPSKWLITPDVQRTLTADEIRVSFLRHFSGDWGDVSQEDWKTFNQCLITGRRLLSKFWSAGGVEYWVNTDPGHEVSTMFLEIELLMDT